MAYEYRRSEFVMTKERFVSDEDIGKISKKMWELHRRVREGTLDIRYAEKVLQRLIEGALEIDPEKIRKQAKKCSHRHPNGGGRILGSAHADPEAFIGENAIIGGDVWIRSKNVRIEDNVIVYGRITMDGSVRVSKSAIVFGHAWLMDNVHITEEVCIGGRDNAMFSGKLVIRGNGMDALKGAFSDGMMIIQ